MIGFAFLKGHSGSLTPLRQEQPLLPRLHLSYLVISFSVSSLIKCECNKDELLKKASQRETGIT